MNLAAFYAAQHTYPAENKQLDSYKKGNWTVTEHPLEQEY